jgi:uncharacterized protein (DUF983 family)
LSLKTAFLLVKTNLNGIPLVQMLERLLSTIFKGKCPSCSQGNMWNTHAYKFSKMSSMNKFCTSCNQNFEPEPMFYTGAMYVGYGFTVAIMVSVFLISTLAFDEPNVDWMIGIVIGFAVIFAPLNFRLSRNIWALIFIKPKANPSDSRN